MTPKLLQIIEIVELGLLKSSCFRVRPVGVWLVFSLRIAGTIAGVAAINLQIVSADRDSHGPILTWRRPDLLHKPVTYGFDSCN